MRKSYLLVALVLIFASVKVFSDESKNSLSYWDAVNKYGIVMTQDERFKDMHSILPYKVDINLWVDYVVDDKKYGEIWFGGAESSVEWDIDISEKNIVDGLYCNKYPMLKKATGRTDLKWIWKPAILERHCIYFKFSYKGKTSDWLPITGGGRYEFLYESNNPNDFKLEGIRLIYNFDYKLFDWFYEKDAYSFVNGDKSKNNRFVAGGAKYIDLKGAVFDKVIFNYEQIFISDSTSVKKLYEIQQKEAEIKAEKQRKEAEEREKAAFIKLNELKEKYLLEKKFSGGSLLKVGEVVKGKKKLEVYCFGTRTEEGIKVADDEFFKQLIIRNINFFNQEFDEPELNDLISIYNRQLKAYDSVYAVHLNTVRFMCMFNTWSRAQGFKPVYGVKGLEMGTDDIEEVFLYKNLKIVKDDSNPFKSQNSSDWKYSNLLKDPDADGYRWASEEDCEFIAKNKKQLPKIIGDKIDADFLYKNWFIVRTVK